MVLAIFGIRNCHHNGHGQQIRLQQRHGVLLVRLLRHEDHGLRLRQHPRRGEGHRRRKRHDQVKLLRKVKRTSHISRKLSGSKPYHDLIEQQDYLL